jgi:hypothetical protein
MRNKILTAAVLAACTSGGAAMAADVGANSSIGGEAYFDLSHISQQSNGVDVPPTGTGFDVKRFYLAGDHKFDDVYSADLTVDAQYYSATGATLVFIKKLYLQAKLDDAFVVHVGSYTSPWAPFVEGLYGYRYVEKTATDRLGFANTADWGLNATGVLADKMVNYSLSIVNGGGYKNPTRTKDVDFEGRVAVTPVKWLTVGAGFYSGHLAQITSANDTFPSNTASRVDLAVGVTVEGLRVGGEYFEAKNYKSASPSTGVYAGPAGVVVAASATGTVVSDKADGFSGWASYSFTDQFAVFGRYDEAKLSKDVVSGLKDTFFDLGVAYKPSKPLDIALVYKNEKVDNGTVSIGSGDANTSYVIGGTGAAGTGATTSGKFDEVGVYAHYTF